MTGPGVEEGVLDLGEEEWVHDGGMNHDPSAGVADGVIHGMRDKERGHMAGHIRVDGCDGGIHGLK